VAALGGARREAPAARRQLAGALLLGLLLLGPTLLLRGAWAPDETRSAEVSREMLEHASFAVPRLYGAPYSEKPPLYFWNVAALQALGVPLETAPRLVSVVASLLTLALLPAIGAPLGLAPGLVSRGAFLLATTPLFLAYGQLGLLDAWLALLVTVAVAAKLGRARSTGARRVGLTLLEGAALGGALLTKGPVALLFPLGLRLGALAGRQREPAGFDRSDAGSVAVATLVALAWLAAAAAEAGADYARALTLGQLASRIGGLAPHQHAPGWLLGVVCVGMLPWSAFALRALVRDRRKPVGARWRQVAPLAGWLGVPAVLLSALPVQQPHYLLPALPAAALLLAPATHGAVPAAIGWPLRGLGAGLAASLLAAGLAPGWLLAWVDFDQSAAFAIALEDPILRLALCLGGALVLGLACLPRPSPCPAWRRAGIASAALFGVAVVATWRADAVIMPRALLRDPAVTGAKRLAPLGSLRAAACLARERSDVAGIRKGTVPGTPRRGAPHRAAPALSP
jgi:4-amino-4-deoxy-L-arabinose transferase-like glycosyltransferase